MHKGQDQVNFVEVYLLNVLCKSCVALSVREHGGSVVEGLTRDRRDLGLRLTGVTVLFP